MKGDLDGFKLEEVFIRVCGSNPYKHQLAAAEKILEGKSVVIRAPCGSGKTEACFVPFLLAEKSEFPNRLVYSLPTRALVEDIAERLREKMGKLGAFLSVSCQHGANPEDPFFKEDIIVATIDQTIGAYCCTPLSLPAYLGNIPAGAVTTAFLCFDEVHTYDHWLGLQSMLALIEQGHERLGLPFVVMSATLPDSFIEWFKEKNVEVVEGEDEYVPSRKNRRVHIHWVPRFLSEEDVLNAVSDDVRVMVVCNTVFKAQEIYRKVAGKLSEKGVPVFILHSRFLPEDRSKIEDKMKAIFKSGRCGCLVTTQVCEVGLDVSCDVMLTEVAPPDSLVQRIGRCARRGGQGQVYIYDVEFPAPYEKGLVEETKRYVAEHLDGKILGWKEELEFVNTLLDDRFKKIMKDKKRRLAILRNLGDAAFKGDKRQIEENIRQVLNANVTIHENPESLNVYEILGMPWISVNINVLKSQLSKLNAKYWQLKFFRAEERYPNFYAIECGDILPYEFYVIHPDYAQYTDLVGLIFGEHGKSLVPKPYLPKYLKKSKEYETETWVEHSRKCMKIFRKIADRESWMISVLSRLLEVNFHTAKGLIALCVALHDIGKLNIEWQKAIGAVNEPLAHAPQSVSKEKPPPHAAISGYALLPVLEKLLKDPYTAIIFELAIGHHHFTRAFRVPSYKIEWLNAVKIVVNELLREYSLKIDVKDIKTKEEFEGFLESSFLNIEDVRSYVTYCILSRFIRICDIESLIS